MAKTKTQETLPEVIPAAQPNGDRRLSSLVPAQDSDPNTWTTNLDVSDPRQRAVFIGATNPADVDMGERDCLRFVATHYLVYPDEILNRETGELQPGGRLVLIDKEGKTFKTCSEFAPKTFKKILALYNDEEWRAGIAFIITSRKSRGGPGRYIDLRVEIPPGDPAN